MLNNFVWLSLEWPLLGRQNVISNRGAIDQLLSKQTSKLLIIQMVSSSPRCRVIGYGPVTWFHQRSIPVSPTFLPLSYRPLAPASHLYHNTLGPIL